MPFPRFDVTGQIVAYEHGDLNDADTIDLFQYLVDSGLAYQLQGHYGRTADTLIRQHLVSAPSSSPSHEIGHR